eukprot:1793-Heterococcus_DN1.PRE.2
MHTISTMTPRMRSQHLAAQPLSTRQRRRATAAVTYLLQTPSTAQRAICRLCALQLHSEQSNAAR